MGFFHKFKKMRKFGHKLAHSAKKLTHKVNHVVTKGVEFAEKKALPMAEKITKGINKGIKLAEPFIGAMAPELIPAMEGAKKLSGMANKGLKGAEKGIAAVKKGQMKAKAIAQHTEHGLATAVKQAKRGDLMGAVESAKSVNPLKR